jgi:putative SOS response-associated peptidase YedK
MVAMCGRYTLTLDAAVLAEVFGLDETPWFSPRYNIAPTQQVPIIRRDEGGSRRWDEVRWGLVPFWAKDEAVGNRMINARAETVADKPAYRAAFGRRRCLIPADGFLEWKKEAGGKQPYLIRFRNRRPFAFAGLWEVWRGGGGEPLQSCTIITTRANALVETVHDRMPVILPPATYPRWLDPGSEHGALEKLLLPFDGDDLEAVAVSRRVSSPANDDPDCLTPVASGTLW